MYCQLCGAKNPDESDFCGRCNQKLLVLSGGAVTEGEGRSFEQGEEESFSFDEHLLERVSILEEAVKRTAETVRELLSAFSKQERSILINQAGLASLRDVLADKSVVQRDEWNELWESKVDYQMLALEKRERFSSLKGRIAALYRGDRRRSFERLLEEAEYALFAFDLERALESLVAAHKLDRENYELNHFLGESYFNEGRADLALPFLARVLEARPDHYEGLIYSGVIHHEQGQGAEAKELLQRAVALYPESFLALFSLGAVYASDGQLARAAALLEKAVDIEPVSQALFLLGSCLYEMGKLTAAIRQLERVVRQDPAHEEAHHLLGLAYLDRKWNRKALEAFRQAQRLNPRKMAYQDLIRYLSGQTSSPLPAVGKRAREWLRQGEELLAGGRPERALACYHRALEAERENPTLLLSFAVVCLQLDRCQEAEQAVRKVLELEPGEMLKATAYATLIEALRSEGRFREGNRIGRRLLDEGASDFARTIAYYEMAYNLAEMEEDLDRALDYAQRSLDLAPEELRQFPLAAMGWVHYKRREFDQAVEFLDRSSRIGSSATTLRHLGMALLASGQEDRARGVLAEARELEGRGISVEQRMMECLKVSSRLLERVQQVRGE